MLAYNYSESHNKSIGPNDLQQIQWCQTVNPVGLADREQRLFQLVVAALRMNRSASSIKVSVAELARAHQSAHLGACSPSTARRALAGLEAQGYLRRRRFRLGADRLGLEIRLNLDRWAYWTQNKTGNVSPLPEKKPTSVYIPPQQSMRLGDDHRTTQSIVNTRNSVVISNNKHTKPVKKVYRHHPIVFTLWVVLSKCNAPDRDGIVSRARIELESRAACIEISNHSGTPWEQFESAWSEMAIPTRESFAAAEIIPRLRGGNKIVSDEPVAVTTDQEPYIPPEEIRSLIEKSLSPSPVVCDEPAPAPEKYPRVDPLDDEMRILIQARDRARARFVDSD